MSVRLRARLPKGDVNGLAELNLAAQLRNNPGTRVLVALVAPVAVEHDLESGAMRVTLGIEAAELLDTPELRDILVAAYEERTGRVPLPYGDAFVDEVVGMVADLVADVTDGQLELTPSPAPPARPRGRARKAATPAQEPATAAKKAPRTRKAAAPAGVTPLRPSKRGAAPRRGR